MKKKMITSALVILMMMASTSAFAAPSSDDVLNKLKEIQSTMQSSDENSSSEILLPTVPSQEALGALPSVADIKLGLGDNPQDQLSELKADTVNTTDPAAFLKLAIALELTGDPSSAVDSLHKAIALAPDQQELYVELVSLYQKVSPGKISVFINGVKLDFKDGNSEVDPVIFAGVTLVPIRKITEQLGAKVEWDPIKLTANIRLLDTTLQLVQDSKNALVNGNPVPTLTVPAQNVNGHIEVPLRFISEQMNKTVQFIPGENGTDIITIVDKTH